MPSTARVPEPARALSDAVLGPVRGHHAFETCVARLATAIRLGVFPRGTVLPPERDLADRMGVSRATLREAMAALRSAGMIRTTRGRHGGTVVCFDPTSDREREGGGADLGERLGPLLDSLVLRRMVEPGAAHLAATRDLTATERMQLTTALNGVEGSNGPAEHRQADSRLHLSIASVTGSARTVQAVAEAQAALHELLSAIPVLTVNIAHSDIQHRTIVQAILAGDPARARRAMEQHCDDTAALLRGLLAVPATTTVPSGSAARREES